ncbi:MAG: hypothetical protein BZ138_04640 [Methanosphaera sp. rholeuAM270]|nr:MAG: hypothetical protein BZ138_04640 [Methanosphaera sp. rholeuAM270]
MNSRVHIIFCHPSKKSVSNAIKDGYINGLKNKNIEYTMTDLYETNFNSDMSEEEYLRENNNEFSKLSEEVLREQELINKADILTFIFPLFWMDAPAKLVGYFSRVFTKGFKYPKDDVDEGSMKVLKQTNFLITTGSSFEDLRRDGKIKALEVLFIQDRMAGKSKKNSMYFFSETTYEKEKILHNKERYAKQAEYIGRKTY